MISENISNFNLFIRDLSTGNRSSVKKRTKTLLRNSDPVLWHLDWDHQTSSETTITLAKAAALRGHHFCGILGSLSSFRSFYPVQSVSLILFTDAPEQNEPQEQHRKMHNTWWTLTLSVLPQVCGMRKLTDIQRQDSTKNKSNMRNRPRNEPRSALIYTFSFETEDLVRFGEAVMVKHNFLLQLLGPC